MSNLETVFAETGAKGLRLEVMKETGGKAGNRWKLKLFRDKKVNGNLPGNRRIHKVDLPDLEKLLPKGLKALAADMKKTPDPEPAKPKEAKPAKASAKPAGKAPAKAAPAKATGKKATGKKAPAKPTAKPKPPVKDNGVDGVNIDELI